MMFKNKINLSLIIFGLLGFILVFFIIHPLFLEIKTSSQDLISQKEAFSSFEEKIKNLIEFKKNYPEIRPNLEKIPNLFINSEAPVEFITFLEETARSYQLLIEISPGLSSDTKGDLWPSLSFRITTLGSFSNFLKFLEKLESSPYLIETQDLNIKRLTESELQLKEGGELSLGDVRANLSIKTFTK